MSKSNNDKVLKKLMAIPHEMTKNLETILDEVGYSIIEDSKRKTPVEYDVLRTSHYYKINGTELEVGATANYAIYVHENLEAHHPQGEALFLKKAVDENEAYLERLLKNQLLK